MKTLTKAAIVLATVLLAGAVSAQEPQEWSSWRKLTNPDNDAVAAGMTWRWRKIAVKGDVNVPLEIEVRDANAKPDAKMPLSLTVLYERAIIGNTYERDAPRKEICYLTCKAADTTDGARCEWVGTETAVGTKVNEARVTH